MSAARRKNIFRRVRSTFSRFAAILFIVALGSGFMAGLAATSPDMLETADTYYDQTRWYDLDVKSPLGFTREDVLAAAAVPGVGTVQCARVMDLVLEGSDDSYTCRVYGILDGDGQTELNRPRLTGGRMPENDVECVVQVTGGRYTENAPQPGDTLTLSADNDGYDALTRELAGLTLKVVGIAESPMSVAVMQEPTNVGSGGIALHVFARTSFFDLPYYTDLYVEAAGARETDTFGDDYAAISGAVTGAMETLGKDRGAARLEQLRADAREALPDLRATRDVLETLVSLCGDMNGAAAEGAELNARTAALLREAGSGLAALPDYSAEKADAPAADAGPRELLTKAVDAIAEAESLLDEDIRADWIVRTRADSEGYASYDSNVGKVSALAKIFPVFFFMVALLVALTTMTRLVEENRGEAGTLKALGFSDRNILGEYLLYGLAASAVGCVLGFAVGFRLFPWAIYSAYSMMYTLPSVVLPVRWNIVAWVAPVTVGSIVFAAFFACFDEFRSCPAALMQPKAPPAGKRIFLEKIGFLWKRLSFSHKVTCRNLFRYKKRLFMTLLGVAGCTSLLVTGFGLRDSINDIVDKQFNDIYAYELTLVTDGGIDAELEAFLADDSLISGHMYFRSEDGRVRAGGRSEGTSLCIPAEPERFDGFVSLRERKSGTPIPFPADGAVLTEKLCETLGVGLGDTVTLENGDGLRGDTTVTGITENYLTSFAYLSPAVYEKLFGEAPECTTILCCFAGDAGTEGEGERARGAVTRALESAHVLYAGSSVTLKETFADSIGSINGVVWVLILAAGLLCMVVLYSLTNVNICERRKELSTIAVLGFREREVESYIFRETNVLSLLGSLCGLGLGVWLHSYVVRTVEVEQVMFGRQIYLPSYLYAVAISMIFTLIVNQILRRRIRQIDMVEAMKANE